MNDMPLLPEPGIERVMDLAKEYAIDVAGLQTAIYSPNPPDAEMKAAYESNIEDDLTALRAAVHAYAQSYADARVRELEKDAARWRALVGWAVENNGPDTEGFTFSHQPSGYNGNPYHFVEFGWPGEKWKRPTIEEMNAAIDRAMEGTK